MPLNKEELKKKILYRSSYRGTKEMDILLTSFVKSIISNLDNKELLKLNDLVNLDDETLYKLKRNQVLTKEINNNEIIIKFKNFNR